MKIEKVNENQIRCTLSRQDLADRQINLRELAYGSEKAKVLFQDMIQQANYEFGFDANDIPLMVEAIPLSSESLILLITKVEYPDELDTRFSNFSELGGDELFHESASQNVASPKGADDILGIFNKIREKAQETAAADAETKGVPVSEVRPVSADCTKMFEFPSLDQVERLAGVLADYYDGHNDLYKNEKQNSFYLVVHKDEHTPEEFNKICNVICEYARQKNYTRAMGAFFSEHGKKIMGPRALQMLTAL